MLHFLGDINFTDGYFHAGHGVGTLIANRRDPFELLSTRKEDFWIGNLECVITNPPEKHAPFAVSPDILEGFRHLDLYVVANNHATQYGNSACEGCFEILETRNKLFVGANSKKSITFEHQNKSIGILAFSLRPDNFVESPAYWHLPEYSEILEEINKIQNCDYKIAYIHWVYEFMNYPNIDQKQLAHFMIDSGIDLIIGCHPHLSQGIETYKGKHICYSLGNAVFNMSWEPTRYGLTVTVDLSKDEPVVSTEYIKLNHEGFPQVVSQVPADYSLEHLNSLLQINEENEKYFRVVRARTKQYRKENKKDILVNILKGKNKTVGKTLSDYIRRRILHSK